MIEAGTLFVGAGYLAFVLVAGLLAGDRLLCWLPFEYKTVSGELLSSQIMRKGSIGVSRQPPAHHPR